MSSSFISKHELLAKNIKEMPKKTIKVENLGDIEVQALRGTVRANLKDGSSADSMKLGLQYGLVHPALNEDEIQELIDHQYETAGRIYGEIISLTVSMRKAEDKERESAEKN